MTKPLSVAASNRSHHRPRVSGKFVGGHYAPHPDPPHYCVKCDLGFTSPNILSTHEWLKHNGPTPTFTRVDG